MKHLRSSAHFLHQLSNFQSNLCEGHFIEICDIKREITCSTDFTRMFAFPFLILFPLLLLFLLIPLLLIQEVAWGAPG